MWLGSLNVGFCQVALCLMAVHTLSSAGDNLSHNHLTVMACLGEAWTIPVTIMQQKASITKAAEEFLREKVVQATSEDEAS